MCSIYLAAFLQGGYQPTIDLSDEAYSQSP